MRTLAVLLSFAACTSDVTSRTAWFPPERSFVDAALPVPTVVVTPGYVGSSDVDLAKLPPAPVADASVAMRHGGGPRTSFRFATIAVEITASNDARGPWIDGDRHGAEGCMIPPPPLHRARALTTEEWRHLVWLVNLAEVERIAPRPRADTLVEAMSGMSPSTFSLSSPEGDAEVDVRAPDADNLIYVVRYLRELVGDGF